MGRNREGETVRVGIGVGVETGFAGTVTLALEVGVRYGSFVPHRSLPQAERIIPITSNRTSALPVCDRVTFIHGRLYPSN